jgi:hypothetical protein
MGPEKKLLPIAILYSAILGCVMPINGFLLSKIVAKFTEYFILIKFEMKADDAASAKT